MSEPQSHQTVTQAEPAASEADAFENPLVERMAAFLRQIGLSVRAGEVAPGTNLPGIVIERGVLVVDEARMTYPGDLLHEAGHMAVVEADRRAAMHRDVGSDQAEEMMAIIWSYAAARHLRIDPALVFHAHGYRGVGAWYVETFDQRYYPGLPMLQWCGLAYDEAHAKAAGAEPFPAMQRWLRA